MNYDENPIIVTTAYTFDELKAFQRFNGRKPRYFMIALLFLLALLVSTNADAPSFLEALPFLGVFAALFLVISGLLYTRGQYERATKTLGDGLTFHFQNELVAVINEHPEHAAQGLVPYGLIHRIYEKDDMFYIYINREKAFLVSKLGFQNHDPDTLQSLLLRKTNSQAYRIK